MSEPTSRRIALRTGLGAHVLEWGAESARAHTVVLVHGFLDNAWGFSELAPRLAEKFHVVAPDMRGHGDSDRIGAGGYYHFIDYVADLAEIVRLCAREQVSLVGHSMGGGIVGYWAGAWPERPARVALLEGMGPPEQLMDPQRVAAWVRGWTEVGERVEKRYASVEAAAERMRRADPRMSTELALRLATHGTRPVAGGGVTFKHDPLHTTTGPYGFQMAIVERFWRRIACPVLAVDGADSDFRLAPEEAARREAAFSNLKKITLPGAGHMMQRHQPVALADALLEFLGPTPAR
jgi:pimeloyl-ACP methyl ester carboxylesterase